MNEPAKRKSVGASVALAITGMTCGGCAGAVKRLLSKAPGVSGVEIDLALGRALVTGTAREEALLAALRGTGYAARPA
ncbi:MAG: heavy-metal-associated domain-containing protein [Hyphomicrobiales bacterium]|nr:heavy-metal-associated domain-containing protein [Hyphomicrobiales bacterium]MBV8427734.1 heavy-metal-associated domain-containing protein [Hyphomicrobiales bacterium]